MEHISSKMDNHIKEVLKMANKAGVDIDIQTVMSMKVTGGMISSKVKELCGILISTSMKASGSKERKMDGENISTIMALSIKETFLMEESKVLEQSLFLMEPKSKLIGNKHTFKDKGKYFIPMAIFSKANIICLKSMAKDYIFGVLTIPNMKDNLKKTLYRGRLGYISLPINIIMVESEMESEMAKEIMFIKMEILLLENGKMI
jgi:transcriptional regulator with GAF, ATPase, and Fis domain